MTSPANRSPRAGGVLIAAGIIIGVFAGGMMGQPSIGFLAGLAVGSILMAAMWLIDRRR